MPTPATRVRTTVVISYVAFVLTGIAASVGSVVLPAQMTDYTITRQAIGITFFTFSAGFFLAGSTTGALMARLGTRLTLVAGSCAFVAAAAYTATRPSFVALVVVQLLAGYGTGLVESVLNAYLTGLPAATVRLNMLHAFFGVGALIGPVLATWMLQQWSWTAVWLLLGVLAVPIGVAYAVTFPARDADPAPVAVRSLVAGPEDAVGGDAVRDDGTPDQVTHGDPSHGDPSRGDPGKVRPDAGGLLASTLRDRGVVLAAVFLTVYVGVEMSTGSWGVNYLQEHRTLGEGLAGAALSGYWLGLTAGRFVISPVATALRWTTARMTTVCLVGVVVCGAVVSLAPFGTLAGAFLVPLGFFLGPLFPTAIAIVPRLTEARLVPTAVGLMNAVSVIGGSALPWLAGALGDTIGIGTLMPYVTGLAIIQLLIWRAVVVRMH